MIPSEVPDLLKRAAALDGRFALDADTVAVTVEMWFRVLAGVDYGDAVDVLVDYYSAPADRRIQPGDVVVGVEALRRDRVALACPRVEELMADVDPADPAYNRIWRERQAAYAARPTARPALPAAR